MLMMAQDAVFFPLGVFVGTALIGAVISGWVAWASRPAPRRAQARSADIFIFPSKP